MINYSIKLDSGVKLTLESYYKTSALAGLMEGDLDRDRSLYLWRETLSAATLIFKGDIIRDVYSGAEYPFDSAGILPPVATIAKFCHFSPVNDFDKMASCAVLAWLEDGPDYLVSVHNLDIIKKLNWSALARDFDY